MKTPPVTPMTPTEFEASLIRLQINDSDEIAGSYLGADPRTIRRWRSGERAVPPQLALLLRLLVHRRISLDTLADVVGRTVQLR